MKVNDKIVIYTFEEELFVDKIVICTFEEELSIDVVVESIVFINVKKF